MRHWCKFLSGCKILAKQRFKFVLVIINIFLLLSGCQAPSKPYAPIEDGWQQNKADYHQVQPGETLYAIAWYYGADVNELARINHLKPPYSLKIDDKIYFHQSTSKYSFSNTKSAPPHAIASKKKAMINKTMSQQWQWPTAGKIVQSFNINSRLNKGIEITGQYRQPIYASLTGEVVYSGNGLAGYGNLIIIKHSADYLSAYAFNAKNLVVEGEHVKSGQQIALMGKLNGQKPQLHFELRYRGQPVNPMLYIKQRQHA